MIEKWLIERFVAHRGFHDEEVKENTIDAFQKAINRGYNIELDVQLTRDNVPVVFHDLHLLRLTGKDCFVRDIYYEELKEVRYLNSNIGIPLFEEVLKLCEGKTGIMIEVKKSSYQTNMIDVEPIIMNHLTRYKGEYVVKSFNPFSVDWFLHNTKGIVLGLLSEYKELNEYDSASQKVVSELLFGNGRRVDFFDYAIGLIGSPLFNDIYKKMPIITWTVKSQQQYDSVKDIVDNIIFEGFVPEAIYE